MIIRSLRWRLAASMVLIIGTVVAAAGVFSTLRVTRELNELLLQQRHADNQAALRVLAGGGPDALRRAHELTGSPLIVTDAAKHVIARYPPELASFDVGFRRDGVLTMSRLADGRAETMLLRIEPVHVDGLGEVYVLPKRGPRAQLRPAQHRWLIAGLAAAALLAMLVMLTIFRRVLAPVEALTAGARALAGGRLEARVPVRGDDEVAELGRAFNSMAEGLERNERARRNMVSDVAHELRTPLTNMRVQLEAAQDGLIAADAHFLTSIEEEAATLARLVDDLQQLSLAEAGQLRLEIAEVRVAEIVERAAPASVVRDVPDDLVVRGDARRLVQVVRNLVVNAMAHAASRVEVRAARVGGGVEIRVIDDGPGVPDEHAERIFDRFHRVDASRSRSTGGAGLGLAIARQLVELHGGRIWYERPAFVVALP
ncbi:MAG TPA: ATP-binding protein [Thermoanaerobaculia bacterium]|nr:ATP-binding protein [Thermoanaerobaculia bacterium]